MTITLRLTNRGWEGAIQDAGILEYGSSIHECLLSVAEAIAFRVQEYAQASDETLDPAALKVARVLRAALEVS